MELLIGAGSIFLNFWLLYWKVTNGRKADAALDFTMIVILTLLFKGTATGISNAMAGGALISIGLLIFPPDINKLFGLTPTPKPGSTPTPSNPYPDWYYKTT